MYKKFVLIFLLLCIFQNGYTVIKPLKFNHYTVDNGLSQNTILSIAEDKFGFIWLGTLEGANRFDGYSFKTFRAEDDKPGELTNNRISCILLGSDGTLWLQTGDVDFVSRFNYETEKFDKIAIKNAPFDIRKRISDYAINRIKAENVNYSWHATENGLVQVNKSLKESFRYTVENSQLGYISDNIILSLFIDSSKNLWVGTKSGGVHVANTNNNQFGLYTLENAGSSENIVRAISVDHKNRLWVGTETNGIAVFNKSAGNTVVKTLGKKELINTWIRSLYRDSENQMWIGTKGGLMRYDLNTDKIYNYLSTEKSGIPDPWIFAITEDHNRDIWVGTFNGFTRFDRRTGTFQQFDVQKLLKSPKVRAIIEDKQSNLWIGTEGGGVTKLVRKGVGFEPKHYLHNSENTNSLINNMVLTLSEDKTGNIWIGTNSGLCVLNTQSDEFKRFSIQTGFPDNLVMGLLIDEKNNVWVSHKKGITCINAANFIIKSFNKFDGLQANEFNQNAFFRDKSSGELFFGGLFGVNSFFSDKLKFNYKQAIPVFTGLKILNKKISTGEVLNDQVILKKSLQFTHEIELNHKNNNFSISFSTLNYSNPQGCYFKYRLKGIDNDWIITDATVREATYTYLPAGKYVLEVFASNSDGVWSENPAVLVVKVLPAWWQSMWAKFIYSISVLALIWFVFRYLKSKIEYRNNLKLEQLKTAKNEELTNLKLQFFTEISHEFRTPVSLIIDPLEQLINNEVEPQNTRFIYHLMHKNANRLLDLINQLLDFRKLQSGKLKLQCVNADIIELTNDIKSTFDKKAHDKKIRFIFQHDVADLFVSVDVDKYQKIIANLLSNAFRFTPEFGEIIISLKAEKNDFVEISVIDNGSGISVEDYDKIFEAFYQVESATNQPHTSGLGLALVKELVLLHGGQISVSGEKAKGAGFHIKLPLKQADINMISQSEKTIRSEFKSEIHNEPKLESSENQELPLLLLVDDQQDIRDYLQVLLTSEYRIITAENGLDAFNKATEFIPDLIVSDVMMPGVDGFELCNRLKKNELTSHIPVILLTARQSDESRITGYETGADAYIVKPFNSKILQTRIENLLDQRRNLRKLFSDSNDKNIATKVSVNVTDDAFIKKVIAIINDNIEDPEFEQDILSEKLRISRSQLYRKIRAITNRSVHEFIVNIRMNKARELLLSGDFSVAEVAYKVGYSLPTNFTRTFTKHFGVTPKKYVDNHKK